MGKWLRYVPLFLVCHGCTSTTQTFRFVSPDGRACAVVTDRRTYGLPLPGPEPPPQKRGWVRCVVSANGKVTYDSGYEDSETHLGTGALDVVWSPTSAFVAYRLSRDFRIVSRTGSARAYDVIQGSCTEITSFKWVGDDELLVVCKGRFSATGHFYNYLAQAREIRIVRVQLAGKVVDRYRQNLDYPTVLFHGVGFLMDEISPYSNRVASSDGHGLCVYDDAVGRIIAKVRLQGPVEGIWWATDDDIVVGLGVLSGERRFAVHHVRSGRTEDWTALLSTCSRDMFERPDWFRPVLKAETPVPPPRVAPLPPDQ